jgi:cyclase
MMGGIASGGDAQLREIGDGAHAYLQRDGSWGWSNAGLVTSRGDALLVDTLYDLNLTRRMLDAMRRATPAADNIETVVNTHANGDHCWGNQLVAGAEIVSSRRAAEEMRALSPRLMKGLVRASRLAVTLGASAHRVATMLGRAGIGRAVAFGEAADFVARKFGPFDFEGIELCPPTTTFDGELKLKVGDKDVHLIEVGPAHSRGDAIVYVPADRVVFSGDILFIGSHPIVWEGPVENWIRACDRILALDVDTVVPGHGPITDKKGVHRVKDYWEYLLSESRRRFDGGMTAREAAGDIALDGFAGWIDRERIAVNVDTIYREFSGDRSRRDPLAMLALMARFERA